MASGDGGDINMPAKITEIDDDEEEIEDETLCERLYGLTEMFPESLRNCAYSTMTLSFKCSKSLYRFTRSAMWIGATSFIILVAPVVFEQERYTLEQQQLSQQRQMLLGPNAAMSGALGMPQTPTGMAPPPPTR